MTSSSTGVAVDNAAPSNRRHLPGLGDVPAVTTRSFAKTQIVAAQAAELGEIAVVAGNPGLGKTFALQHSVDHQDLPWVWLDMPPRPRPKELVVRLLNALAGGCNARQPLYLLTDDLVDVLAEEPRVVVIDEAQHLDADGMNQLRYLHDRRSAEWALLFAGGVGCEKVLASEPQLDDRIAGRVRFAPLEGQQLLATLDAYSPFFAAADRDLLLKIDHIYAKGVFRRWARLLQRGSRLAANDGTDRLTAKVAKAALSVVMRDQAAA